ncbi:glycosyltransferase family 2 protein [Novipirellula sp.]|uniref:glycosyltransferase family 2 protein n=1 Tax=Novipirellula sp. TaxID=2795430 RepID=UPI0035617120
MTSKNNPLISVVIPCYNASVFIRETLDSVRSQTYKPLEVIIVDDGSTDDSVAIAESYGSFVSVIQQENQGESVARNRGIEEAKGDWIAFLDADDVWAPKKLQRQVAEIDSQVVCIHTNYYNFGTRSDVREPKTECPEIRYRLDRVAANNPFFISTVMVPRSVVARFPEWTRWGEDTLYYLDLLQEGTVRLVDEPLAGNRRHPQSQSRDIRTEIFRHEGLVKWLELRSDTLDDAGETRRRIETSIMRTLAEHAVGARSRREWNRYHAIREYLSGFPDSPYARQIACERIYPQWLYHMKDRFSSLVGSAGSEK